MADHRIPVLQIDVPIAKPGRNQPELDEASRKLYADTFANVVRIETSKGTGTGFAVQKPNLIVTDYHCLLGSNEVKVRTADGKVWKATVKDIDDVNDLALLEIQGNPSIKPYDLGDERNLKPEGKITGLGHPRGSVPAYISPGTYIDTIAMTTPQAAFKNESVFKGRTNMTLEEALANEHLTPGQRKDLQQFADKKLIYGRIHIRPGNSGGPLLNEDGKVVGISLMGAKDLKYSHSLFTPVSDLKALLDRPSPQFQFQHEYRGAEWTRIYSSLLQERPLLGAAGTGAAGYAGYRGLIAQNSMRAVLPSALMAVGAVNLMQDGSNTFSATTTLDRYKYGAATLGDAGMAGGGLLYLASPLLSRGTSALGHKAGSELLAKAGTEATKSLTKTGKIGLGIIALGTAVKYGSDFIPNRLVRTDLSRADGDDRPPFLPPVKK